MDSLNFHAALSPSGLSGCQLKLFLSTLPLTETVLSVLLLKSLSSYLATAKMPPKKAAAAGPSKKAENKKKDRVIEVSEICKTTNEILKLETF